MTNGDEPTHDELFALVAGGADPVAALHARQIDKAVAQAGVILGVWTEVLRSTRTDGLLPRLRVAEHRILLPCAAWLADPQVRRDYCPSVATVVLELGLDMIDACRAFVEDGWQTAALSTVRCRHVAACSAPRSWKAEPSSRRVDLAAVLFHVEDFSAARRSSFAASVEG